MKDISGQKFHRLTALYPTEKRDNGGSVIWHCRCDCGNEMDFSYNAIVYSNLKSCGCLKKAHDQVLRHSLTHVDGTSLNLLKSTKTPKNNTTGVKGVYFIRGKYVAKIVFQKKQYILGTFDRLEDAAAVRREAEEVFREEVLAFYEQWKQRADSDPLWAQGNPVKISVSRDHAYRLKVDCLPVM